MTTAILVLAAGRSSRLGRPKQLLPFRGRTLLDAVLANARACPADQRLVALGGAADEVRAAVDVDGFEVVVNPAFGTGCSSSIAAAVPGLADETDVVVLLLGDQPGVTTDAVRLLLDGRGDAPLAVCRYDDGIGHPFAFGKDVLPDLARLHGDKAVWKLLEQRAADVVEVHVPGTIPVDVDTEEDYERLLQQEEISSSGPSSNETSSSATGLSSTA